MSQSDRNVDVNVLRSGIGNWKWMTHRLSDVDIANDQDSDWSEISHVLTCKDEKSKFSLMKESTCLFFQIVADVKFQLHASHGAR